MCDDASRPQKPANGLGCRQVQHGGNAVAAYGPGVPLEKSMEIINQQCQEIYDLRTQLNLVMNERDMLLGEVGRLKFDMELYDQRVLAAHDTVSRYGHRVPLDLNAVQMFWFSVSSTFCVRTVIENSIVRLCWMFRLTTISFIMFYKGWVISAQAHILGKCPIVITLMICV